MAGQKITVPLERVERLIVVVSGQRIMLDAGLAELYGVETKALNRDMGERVVSRCYLNPKTEQLKKKGRM